MAKVKNIPPAGDLPASEPRYKIVGLQMLETMPVHYAGEKYDLADLSDQQAERLIAKGYPHVIRIEP
ncbi:hypothetical protein SAMN05216327_101205 [Dyadobacter sp. SG02]|nr:hypothetical protein SAMN05216327_101205 [Dyadobacter sp. SG02]